MPQGSQPGERKVCDNQKRILGGGGENPWTTGGSERGISKIHLGEKDWRRKEIRLRAPVKKPSFQPPT